MQKIKNFPLCLVSLIFGFFLVSCGANITTSVSEDRSGDDSQEISEDQDPAEVEARELLEELEHLQELLVLEEGQFLLQVATRTTEALLAGYLQGYKQFDLNKMIWWVDAVIENINTVNTPAVNEKIEEIKALRDAETDPEVIARYDELIARMESSEKDNSLDISFLKETVKKALVNLQATEVWIEEEFDAIGFSKARNLAYLAEAPFIKLDGELDKIQD